MKRANLSLEPTRVGKPPLATQHQHLGVTPTHEHPHPR